MRAIIDIVMHRPRDRLCSHARAIKHAIRAKKIIHNASPTCTREHFACIVRMVCSSVCWYLSDTTVVQGSGNRKFCAPLDCCSQSRRLEIKPRRIEMAKKTAKKKTAKKTTKKAAKKKTARK